MDNFSEYIKSKLEDFEMPYDENGWLKIQKKLRVNKIKRITKYIISSLILISSLIYFSTNNNTEKGTVNVISYNQQINPKQLLVSDKPIIEEKVSLSNVPILQVIENIEEKIIVSTICDTTTFNDNVIEFNEKIITDNTLTEGGITDSIDTTNTNVDSLLVDTTTISILSPTYYFPTAFSPNNDGVNDEFYPIGIDLVNLDFQLIIYDRWGNELFESMNPEYKWNGGDCKQGMYIWIFRYQNNEGKIHIDKGQVTLIK